MNYSSRHNLFASHLNLYYNINEQDVLKYPEKYLGPNYKEVLNFWFYLDSLSDEQWNVYDDRFLNLPTQTRIEALKLTRKLASEVINPRFVEWLNYEVREIVAAHLYIDRNIPFTFPPLIFDL
jgi:hypothetical protein